MSVVARRVISVVLLLVGGVGVCCGILPGLLLPLAFDADVARVERLQPISFPAFEDGTPGREALVEGRLSRLNRSSPDGLIIYTRYATRQSSNGSRVWEEVEREAPAVLVDLPEGTVRVQQGYTLDGSLPLVVDRASEEIRGLRPGDTVIALGTLVEGPEGIELRPTTLGVGTRQDYLDRNRDAILFSRIFGWTLLGGGALCFVGGLVLLLRSLSAGRSRGPSYP